MTTKSKDYLPALPLDNGKPANSAGNDNDNDNEEFVFDHAMFNTEDVTILRSIFNKSCLKDIDPPSKDDSSEEGFTKSASVKFMITMQDESDLEALGYSKTEIDKLKPQEAADILTREQKQSR